MEKLKVLELFGGISAPYKALLNLNKNVETVDYVEFDKKVVDIRNKIYDTNFTPKTVLDYHCNEQIDLLIGGSPCQDFSTAGLRMGGEKGSGTRSSLIWEQLRILSETKPKYYIWENVKGVLNKGNIHIFNKHNKYVENLGYKVYYKVLNSKDFGIPQNRNRVFVVAIRNDLKQDFSFDNLETKPMRPLKEFLEIPQDNWYFVKQKQELVQKRLKGCGNEPKKCQAGIMNVLDCQSDTDVSQTIITNVWKGNTSILLSNYKEHSNFIVLNRSKDGECINGAYNRVWKSENYVGTIPVANIPKILVEKSKLVGYSKFNSENYVITPDSKHTQTITASGALSRQKVIIDLKDPYFHTRPIKTDNIASTITASQANFTHRANENKTLEPIKTNELLIVKWKEKLWNVRILTEKEAYLLMGFNESDFNKVKDMNRTILYKTAGNSIVVNVLEAIFKELIK